MTLSVMPVVLAKLDWKVKVTEADVADVVRV